MAFSQRLRERRITLGWTQEQLARRSGLQPAAISHFETGKREPSMRSLVRLATALGETIDWLLGIGRVPADELAARIRTLSVRDVKLTERLVKRLSKDAPDCGSHVRAEAL